MQDFADSALRFDQYRSLNWNLNAWFTQAQAVDLLEAADNRAYALSLLRGLVVGYLDLLGDAHLHLCPTHIWENGSAPGSSHVGCCEVRARLSVSERDLSDESAKEAGATLLIVTLGGAVEAVERNVCVCTLEQFLTGHALRDVVMEGTLWRPCLSKLVQAYNFLVDSQCLDTLHSLRIDAKRS
jgi:hypothetical protein